jgi:hypothetical protein
LSAEVIQKLIPHLQKRLDESSRQISEIQTLLHSALEFEPQNSNRRTSFFNLRLWLGVSSSLSVLAIHFDFSGKNWLLALCSFPLWILFVTAMPHWFSKISKFKHYRKHLKLLNELELNQRHLIERLSLESSHHQRLEIAEKALLAAFRLELEKGRIVRQNKAQANSKSVLNNNGNGNADVVHSSRFKTQQ